MPVKKCKKGKYRIGKGPCVFKSKKKAEAGQKAIYAKRKRKKKR